MFIDFGEFGALFQFILLQKLFFASLVNFGNVYLAKIDSSKENLIGESKYTEF